ncbi:Cation efflux system protein CusC precursor [compost metagenome]
MAGSANNSKNLRSNTTPTESYSTTLSLSYELDLWGKLARAREQAQWQAEATEQDRQNTALTLIGNTAQYYWQIANLNQKIKQQQAGLEISQQTLALVQSRYASGAAGQLDLLQAKQSLRTPIARCNSSGKRTVMRWRSCLTVRPPIVRQSAARWTSIRMCQLPKCCRLRSLPAVQT